MKIIKKNQIIIYTLALMLITAGYLNYTTNMNKSQATSTEVSQEMSVESKNDSIEENEGKLEEDKKEYVENAEGKLVENTVQNKSNMNINENSNSNEETNVTKTNKLVADIGDATLVSSNDLVEDYFAKSKLERENMYSQMLESYEKILNNDNSTEEQKKSITDEIKKLNNTKNSIMICENLIKTKGFENSVVFVNGDSVSVIVGANEIKTEQIAQIQNIISRELNVGVENIHISTK